MPTADESANDRPDRKVLAKIHIAKRDLGLSDEAYRDLLERVAGVRSAKDLRRTQLMAVQRELRRLGWDGYLLRRDEVPRLRYEDLGNRPGYPNPAQLRKLHALWHTIPGYGSIDAKAAYRAFLRKRFGVEHERFLTDELFEAVLAAVRDIRQREGLDRDGRDRWRR